MKNSIILSFICVAIFSLAGCNKEIVVESNSDITSHINDDINTSTSSSSAHIHVPSEQIKEEEINPTCTNEGSYHLRTYCVECHELINDEIKTIPALGHDLINHEGKQATCTESGYTSYVTCSRCDYSTYQEIPATGHINTLTKEENRIESTCTETGSYDLVTYCLDDNTELSRETITIPALGHVQGEPIKENITEASCETEGGYDSIIYCDRCHIMLSSEHIVETAAIGHDYGETTYIFDEEFLTYSANRTCKNNNRHYEKEEALLNVSFIKLPTNEEKGKVLLSYSFVNPAFEGMSKEYEFESCIDRLTFTLNDDGLSYSVANGSNEEIGYKKINSPLIVVIPEKYNNLPVTKIADNGFNSCICRAVYIPNSVVEIGESAFESSNISQVVMPNRIESIKACSFQYCRYLSTIKIPDTVRTICRNAFSNCGSLQSVDWPPSLVEIGNGAFGGCSSLLNCSLPDTLQKIGDGAFGGSGILEIVIPSSVIEIKIPSVINNCPNLESVTIENNDKIDYASLDGIVYNKDYQKLVFCPQNYQSKIVYVREGTEEIVSWAFDKCINISQIVLPHSLIKIGQYVFNDCISLESCLLPDSIEQIQSDFYDTKIQYNVFNECLYYGNDKNPYLVLFDAAKFVGEKLVVHQDCKLIYRSTFYSEENKCYAKELNLSKVQNLPNLALFPNVEKMYVDDNNEYFMSYMGAVYSKDGKSLLIIPPSAQGELHLKNTIENISNSAFSQYEKIESIIIDGSNQTYSTYLGVLYNKEQTSIVHCPAAISGDVVLSNNLLKLDSCSAFRHCRNIKSLYIPASVSDYSEDFLHDSVYYNFVVDEQNEVYSSKDGALFNKNQTTLIRFPSNKEVDYCVPNTVTKIASGAFSYCRIKSIVIPMSVTSIYESIFYGVSNLSKLVITYEGTVEQFNNISIKEYEGAFSSWNYFYVICSDGKASIKLLTGRG